MPHEWDYGGQARRVGLGALFTIQALTPCRQGGWQIQETGELRDEIGEVHGGIEHGISGDPAIMNGSHFARLVAW